MKFFTRQASRVIGTKEGRKDWHRRQELYKEHLNGLFQYLSPGWQQLAKMYLHDCAPFSFAPLSKKGLLLNIDLGPAKNAPPIFICSITFKGVHQSTLGPQSMGHWWLYEEISLSQDGYVELSVLLDKSDFSISAADVEIWENQKTA